MKLRERRKLYDSDDSESEQRRAFTSGTVPVAVYGLGKMGLPLASVFAAVSRNVVGVDVDAAVVERINDGDAHVTGEPGLDDLVERVVDAGGLRATTDAAAAAAMASVHVIVVPTTLRDDETPDLSKLRTAVRDVASGLEPGDLVCVESTVPPRTCLELVRPLLCAESGLDPAEFGVAFCPERTASGRALVDIRRAYPKIVGGLDAESTRAAALVYDRITENDVIRAADATTAECVKVFEGVYRDVNIALANELARFADELGVDVNEAIDAANTQPYCDIHTPGVGVGGHCIPYYPHFLLSEFATEAPLIRTGRQVNENMPLFAIQKLLQMLDDRGVHVEDARVVLLGVTYRPGVDEIRESPALAIADRLSTFGADVYAADPVRDEFADIDAAPVDIEALPRLDPDAVVLVTDHEEFEAVPWDRIDPAVVVDGRQALALDDSGHDVYTIGSGRE
jgi:UDP-N-acetyl-D-mannosaminuronic acid dehydrogenase